MTKPVVTRAHREAELAALPEIERRHIELAVRTLRPKADAIGVRIFTDNPMLDKAVIPVAQALALAEQRGAQQERDAVLQYGSGTLSGDEVDEFCDQVAQCLHLPTEQRGQEKATAEASGGSNLEAAEILRELWAIQELDEPDFARMGLVAVAHAKWIEKHGASKTGADR